MFLPFFERLRAHGVPVSLREYLAFLDGVAAGLVTFDIEGFRHLAGAAMVKDERHFDRFDRAFAEAFAGLAEIDASALVERAEIPADWLEKLAERHITPEERAEVEGAGGFEALMEKLRQRLAEQEKRHQGGSKWIGTAGTSPFGAWGYNPEGVRIGQDRSRHRRATKVWDRRDFADLSDDARLSPRNLKVVLRRLRRWAREGAATELDLPGTIRESARQGFVDVRMRPERRNAARVLMFFDVGGSMDDHIGAAEALVSAARAEFGQLEYFYFHNCLYEGVWRDNARRWRAQTPTMEVLRTYGPEWRCIFVGDASMSPYEVAVPGGASEHNNPEAGAVWLSRAAERWPQHLWLNPVPEAHWRYTRSVGMVADCLADGRMVPMTISGITEGLRRLA